MNTYVHMYYIYTAVSIELHLFIQNLIISDAAVFMVLFVDGLTCLPEVNVM